MSSGLRICDMNDAGSWSALCFLICHLIVTCKSGVRNLAMDNVRMWNRVPSIVRHLISKEDQNK